MGWYNTTMNTITIDKAGRIVVPKPIREELQLSAGDSLELERSDDRIIIRPARSKSRMYKKRGIWVLHTGKPLRANVIEETIRKVREEREQEFVGPHR
jgi:AbrB family looped-hinge helix DNA binding protein